jgi:dihydroneopterin aldolase
VDSRIPTPDSIHIEQLEIFARLGVTDAERDQPQRLTVSMTVWPRRALVDLADDIRNTIDYSRTCDETKAFVRDRSFKLIETLADRLATHLLQRFAMQKITLEVRKYVLEDAEFAAVTVTRTAAVG